MGSGSTFEKIPGRFGPIARKAVATAIDRVAKSANLQDDSWTVVLTFPYSGLTLYGDSLSRDGGIKRPGPS